LKDWKFKVLYDGECPLCRLEVQWLQYLDRSGNLAWEDIAAPDFDPSLYECTLSDLMGTLYGVLPDGRKTHGLETFRQAYRAIGKGWLVGFTGWPVLRPFFDWLYKLFAKHRIRLGRFFGRSCGSGRCSIPPQR